MSFSKKSLGQNFLKDKNIIKKTVNLVEVKNKNIIEIGPGKGALTDEILIKGPRSLTLIEKDQTLSKILRIKYSDNKVVKVYHDDILKINLERIIENKSIIFGNLPYNISSQILIKLIKLNNLEKKISDLIFMFQKELGQKIIGRYQSNNYGRLSIISNYKLDFINKFFVSANCFSPKPKVTSMVIHLKPKMKSKFKIADLYLLEKVTSVFFSKKRKMINKSLKSLLNKKQIKNLKNLRLDSRPSDLKPEIYYKITELLNKSG